MPPGVSCGHQAGPLFGPNVKQPVSRRNRTHEPQARFLPITWRADDCHFAKVR